MDAFHGGNIMKTGEARGIYSSVLKSYNEQKFKLSKQREELKERMGKYAGWKNTVCG